MLSLMFVKNNPLQVILQVVQYRCQRINSLSTENDSSFVILQNTVFCYFVASIYSCISDTIACYANVTFHQVCKRASSYLCTHIVGTRFCISFSTVIYLLVLVEIICNDDTESVALRGRRLGYRLG